MYLFKKVRWMKNTFVNNSIWPNTAQTETFQWKYLFSFFYNKREKKKCGGSHEYNEETIASYKWWSIGHRQRILCTLYIEVFFYSAFLLNCFHFLFVFQEIRALKIRRKIKFSSWLLYFDSYEKKERIFLVKYSRFCIDTHKFDVIIISDVVSLALT